MILQALYEYYQRKASDKESNIAPEGWEWKEIPFLCVINESGSFKYFRDTREERGKKKRAHPYLVPTLGEKKGNGIKANMLWENIEYMFGIPVPTPNKPHPDKKRIKEQHTAFQNRVYSLTGKMPLIKALRKFVSDNQTKIVTKDENWKSVLSANQNILLAVENKKGLFPVTDIPEIRKILDKCNNDKTQEGICLVTGDITEIVRLEPAVKGIAGSDGKAERSLISFNKDAFCSYRKEKNYNAPVGRSASFAYTTALNMLLGKDSLNKAYIADSTVAFWAERTNSKSSQINLEEVFPWTISQSKDDPDKGIKAVKAMLEAINTGQGWRDEGNRFYVLGLSPSSARVSVRFWKVGTTKSMAEKDCNAF
ncbi:MAG: type I-C CRISPR-associated protein Cas8c/Csd1 [Bacteroidota bacterium]